MQTGDISTTRNYINDFATEQGVSFVYGSSQRLVAKTRSKLTYPIIHMNRPMIRTRDNGMANRLATFYLEITIIEKYETKGSIEDEDASEWAAEQAALEMMMELLKKMNHDNSEGLLNFDFKTVTIDPVMDKWIDKHTGWKMSFRLDGGINSKVC